jgi:hypothetical protein
MRREMNTERQHALFIIGSKTLTKLALMQVLDNINTRYGGCTLHKGFGCWSEQGAKFTNEYDNVKFETAYQIEVCTTPEEFDLPFLQSAFKPVAPFATWIHCEVWTTNAYHFDVTKL